MRLDIYYYLRISDSQPYTMTSEHHQIIILFIGYLYTVGYPLMFFIRLLKGTKKNPYPLNWTYR